MSGFRRISVFHIQLQVGCLEIVGPLSSESTAEWRMSMRMHRSNPILVSRVRPLVTCLAIAFSVETFAGSGAGDASISMIHRNDATAPRGVRAAPRVGAALKSPGKSVGGGPDHPASTLLVTNCNDDGADSLREAIGLANASDGYTIQFDLNQMQCSTITLTSGEIDITTNNLTLQGPGADLLTIDGDYNASHINRIFKHTGQGTLAIHGLTLANAMYLSGAYQNAYGGCILSSGTVGLVESAMSNCQVVALSGTSKGGAIHASSAYFSRSRISDSSAFSAGGTAVGGAVRINGASLSAQYSTFENNAAHSYSQNYSGGGGAFAVAGATVLIQHSTISGNHAQRAGGLFAYGMGADVALFDSTISGNTTENSGAIEVNGAHLYAYNTTIAFNSATYHGSIAGVQADSIHAESSIIADNFASDAIGSVDADVKSTDGVVSGGKNLILAAIATTLPADTSIACPRLAPLLDNGGPTRTHALLSGSGAVDAGSDTQSLGADQRGAGFDRVFGAFADIGAFEWSADSADEINRAGFECD